MWNSYYLFPCRNLMQGTFLLLISIKVQSFCRKATMPPSLRYVNGISWLFSKTKKRCEKRPCFCQNIPKDCGVFLFSRMDEFIYMEHEALDCSACLQVKVAQVESIIYRIDWFLDSKKKRQPPWWRWTSTKINGKDADERTNWKTAVDRRFYCFWFIRLENHQNLRNAWHCYNYC